MKPLVAVPSDLIDVDGHPSYKTGDKYVRALAQCADVVPLIIPSLDSFLDLKSLCRRVDGIMLTGGVSNIHPQFMAPGLQDAPVVAPSDLSRDGVTIPLVQEALDAELPLFGICRGLQELNVALGGSIYPKIHEVEGFFDHRHPEGEGHDVHYGPHHEVTLEPGGVLDDMIEDKRFSVNSLHWQGIHALGKGLRVDARAPDGVIEAVSLPSASATVFAVQWHPEYKAVDNPQSRAIFAGFRRALDGERFGSNA